MIQTENCYLLFVEPESPPSSNPVIDIYTKKMTGALRKAMAGISGYGQGNPVFTESDSGWRGFHNCSCGKASTNQEYLIMTGEESSVTLYENARKLSFGDKDGSKEVRAVITNSLAIHYLAYHREDIPEDVLARVLLLEGDEVEPTEEELSGRH